MGLPQFITGFIFSLLIVLYILFFERDEVKPLVAYPIGLMIIFWNFNLYFIMITTEKLIDIIKTMIEYGMLDRSRINDVDYVTERVKIYLEAKKFVNKNFKGMF